MRRTIGAATGLLVIALAVPAFAGAGGARTVSRAYTGAGVDSVAGVTPEMRGSIHGQGSDAEAVVFATESTDRTMRLTAADQTGLPVRLEFEQTAANGDVVLFGRACGKPASVRLAAPGRPVTVYLLTGSCGSTASVPTTGTVTARFMP